MSLGIATVYLLLFIACVTASLLLSRVGRSAMDRETRYVVVKSAATAVGVVFFMLAAIFAVASLALARALMLAAFGVNK